MIARPLLSQSNIGSQGRPAKADGEGGRTSSSGAIVCVLLLWTAPSPSRAASAVAAGLGPLLILGVAAGLRRPSPRRKKRRGGLDLTRLAEKAQSVFVRGPRVREGILHLLRRLLIDGGCTTRAGMIRVWPCILEPAGVDLLLDHGAYRSNGRASLGG